MARRRPGESRGRRADGLRRVSEDGVTEGGYTHHSRPVTGELAEVLVRLHTAGYLTIGAPGPGGTDRCTPPQPEQPEPPNGAGVTALAEHTP